MYTLYYVISGVNGNLKAFLTFISWIDSFDKDAMYIHLGDFIGENNGWEFMNWAQENITPTGKYQAVLSRDIQMVLDACNPSKKSEVAICSAKQNYGLFYLQAMVPKDRKELIGFMESIPVCKEIVCANEIYYVVESWLDEYDLYLMKHGMYSGINKHELRMRCLYAGMNNDNKIDLQGVLIRNNRHKCIGVFGNVIHLPVNQGIQCFCLEKRQFLSREVS